jgi:hypothetical protein
MKCSPFVFILFLSIILSFQVAAQSWNFIKEKDGIKLYTKEETGSHLKGFRGVTVIDAPAEKIFAFLNDMSKTEWWDDNLTLVKVLNYEKNKSARFYMVYNMPWPLVDRDVCVDIIVSSDMKSGESRVSIVSVNQVVPEKDDLVRIKDYHQTWIVKSAGEGKANVVLEGFIDPSGKIPDWVTNAIIVDSPYRAIRGVKEKMK